ncbi:DUF3857 domain-containing protein [Candidatus Acidulodesulfobacterium sp. H_13]|uniref:DUF3857 domain-containing protein n=1 Tax=Candidatus Acidulodesulfobacterium sp. H_13 TaxID=3395470 RepID=UPI003AF47E10
MKKLLSSSLTLLFIFFAALAMLSFINQDNSYAAKIGDNSAKDHGAYIIKKDVLLKLDRDYKLKTYITESVRILSQRGINRYSEVMVPFSTKYQKVKLLYAYTLLRGMFKIPVGKHAVNIVSPGFAVNYPAYSNVKYLTVSMPAVEDGSVINFSYEINNFKPLIKDGVFYTNYFSYTIPVKKINFTLLYPAGLHINLYLHRIDKSVVYMGVIHVGKQKYIKLKISLKDISAIKKESYMPPLENYRKYISVSTYTSWNKLLKNISKMFVKSEKSSEKIKNFVKSAIKNRKNKSQKQKIISIYDAFVKSFRYAGIGYGINGYKPESAKTTFVNGYGDSKSMASLLISMLETEGINAYPVLVSSLNAPDLNTKSISPNQFDSVIVGVTLKERGNNGKGRYYLYPDSSSYKAFKLPFNLSGRKGVLLLNNTFKFIKLPSEKPKQNEKIFLFKGKLNKKGDLKGNISVIYKGVYANLERSSLKNLDGYHKKIRAVNFLYDFIPGANIKSFDYKNLKNIGGRIKLAIRFSDKDYGELNGDKLIFHQILPIDTSLIDAVLKTNRIYPLVMGYSFEHIFKIDLKLPKKANIYYLPAPLKLDNNVAEAYSSCSYSNLKGKKILHCFYKFESKNPTISARDYKKYRKTIVTYLEYLKNYFIAVSSVYFY